MEVIPAIDLRSGQVVRLHQGNYDQQTVFSTDPVGIAQKFLLAGSPRLHIVDLDGAALGMPVNLETIERIADEVDVPIQVGGGIRNVEMALGILKAGAQRIVFGTIAVECPELIQESVDRCGKDAVIVGVDARDGMVAVRGWKETTSVKTTELIEGMSRIGVERFIYTDISRDGTLTSPNFQAVAEVVNSTSSAIIASGGVTSIEDLQHLAALGVEAAIVGSAVYRGSLDLEEAIETFS